MMDKHGILAYAQAKRILSALHKNCARLHIAFRCTPYSGKTEGFTSFPPPLYCQWYPMNEMIPQEGFLLRGEKGTGKLR